MTSHLIGVLPGEGIGPEVTRAALHVLEAVAMKSKGELDFRIEEGGLIGHASIAECGHPLSPPVIDFCRDIFFRGGAILTGAGGDRFVYECRRQFNLYYKLNPLIPSHLPLRARRIKDAFIADVDILVVRENLAGIYQGEAKTKTLFDGTLTAEHAFAYSEVQVRAVAKVACGLAAQRQGLLTIVTKPNGIPSISKLWRQIVHEVGVNHRIMIQELEVDYAAFSLIQDPQKFDVILTSNLFGDILSDIGGLLLGSRGLCYGGSFGEHGEAIYQTNHGAAFDLAGTDRANPVGHLYALAMMLESSFGLTREARLIVTAVDQVWRQGWRTADLAESGCRTIGTQQMADCIAEEIYATSVTLPTV